MAHLLGFYIPVPDWNLEVHVGRVGLMRRSARPADGPHDKPTAQIVPNGLLILSKPLETAALGQMDLR
jgi:hypothetical protein